MCVGGESVSCEQPFYEDSEDKKYIYKEINISHFKEVLVVGMEVVL